MSGFCKKKLLIVSPCRDEIEYARNTLDSIVSQSLLPDKWIIVDDGSTDGTSELLNEYAEKYAFIEVYKRPDRGERSVGPGVVDAFYAGLNCVDYAQYEYLCKLDLDLDIPAIYFESALKRFSSDPKLATISGKPYVNTFGKEYMEPTGDDFSVGMIKLYRTTAFDDIGGFIRQVMWDGIDCHMCRYMGWVARSENSEDLKFYHLRPMGSSQVGIYTGKIRHGYGQYFMGTSALYMLASTVYRLGQYPVFWGALFSLYGYFKASLSGEKRFGDANFRRFLHRYQFLVLLRGREFAMSYILKLKARD